MVTCARSVTVNSRSVVADWVLALVGAVAGSAKPVECSANSVVVVVLKGARNSVEEEWGVVPEQPKAEELGLPMSFGFDAGDASQVNRKEFGEPRSDLSRSKVVDFGAING